MTVELPRFGEILLIGRKPVYETTKRKGTLDQWVYELKGPGRYVVHRRVTYKGEFEYLKRWVEEERIQAIWRNAGSELPEADREPELPHVAAVRLQVILRRFLWTVGDDQHEPFPGCKADIGYRCDLRMDDAFNEKITQSELSALLKIREGKQRFAEATRMHIVLPRSPYRRAHTLSPP